MGGKQTRLIFHLSYDFGDSEDKKSFNHHTPEHLCSVKYKDIDHAIRNCLTMVKTGLAPRGLFFSKTDLKSAFCLIPGKPEDFSLLTMKTAHPKSGKNYYFFDKCLAFRASISCTVFQSFSDCLVYIIELKMGDSSFVTNYLDDFIFYAESEEMCNLMVSKFLELCEEINCPVSSEKTE